MTLEEVMTAKRGNLMRPVPFMGWKPCGNPTGRYYYEGLEKEEKEANIQIEVRFGFLGLSKEWVPLSCIRLIKDAK